MDEIVNTFLLAGDKFMPEMNLRQPGFTQSACETFAKNKGRIQKFKETGDSRYIKLVFDMIWFMKNVKI